MKLYQWRPSNYCRTFTFSTVSLITREATEACARLKRTNGVKEKRKKRKCFSHRKEIEEDYSNDALCNDALYIYMMLQSAMETSS